MKKDFLTALLAAIFGGVVGFVICNLFTGEIQPKTIKTIDSKVSIDLDSPDPEVFNANSLNPRVETYVGEDK